MKKVVLAAFGLVLIAPMAGCIIPPSANAPIVGGAFADVRGPIDSGGAIGSKTGEACSRSWFGVVSVGDSSIATAAKNGGIKTVTSVDSHVNNIVGVARFCTVVTGN